MLSSVFSFLPTPSLALASAVSTNWRSRAKADAPFHRVLNITSLGLKLNELEIIKVIAHFASQYPRPFLEVHLDLSKFWRTWDDGDHEKGFHDIIPGEIMRLSSYILPQLISTLLNATEGKLQRLFLKAEHDVGGRICCTSAEMILEGVWDLANSTEDLREIKLEVPFPLSFSSGGLGKGSRIR